MSLHDRENEFSRGCRMAAMDAALPLMREAATVIARELTGQTTGPFAHHLQNTIEDGFLASVFDADLPIWVEYQSRAEEDRAWDEAEARRAA